MSGLAGPTARTMKHLIEASRACYGHGCDTVTHRENMAVAFDALVQRDCDATALVVGEARWTRGEIATMAASAAGVLRDFGAKAGDAVVAQYRTSAPDLAVALAAARLGCTFMPVPHRLGPYELNYVLNLAQPVLLALHHGEVASQLELPGRTTVLASEELIAGSPVELAFVDEPPGHIPVVGFTSGSTGRPKGVMHRWPGMAWVTHFLSSLVALQPGEPICVTGAGAGVPGFTFFSYFGLSHGSPIVAAERWDPRGVLELMARERCVWSTMVPTMLYMMLEAKEADPSIARPTSMRGISVGGAFMSEELIRRSRVELGLEVLRVYAMAECMMACQMRLTDPAEKRDVVDGWPGPGAEVAVFANDGVTHLPPGEVGEFGLKGPSLFEGYLGDPDTKPERSTPDGFFLSGDMGKLTEDGYVKVVGRKKDLIIRGGFNIDPVEVEELIRQHEQVRDVAVVGYPDERFGERACAFLLVKDGIELGLDRVAPFLLEFGLSKEKLPERVICVTELPRSPDGKILKAELRQQLLAAP
jgi:acyl-CoA synthetase (AMP-forming)/AMP-acid ligase II